MSAADDEHHDDDAQLEQLRAVWVSMRDEDPPDRGLAALMTAARAKASELEARPSWWQRLSAILRRPPVLALATVTLLFGGALIVTQRGSQMKVESVVTTELDDKNLMMADVIQSNGGSDSSAVVAGSAVTVDVTEQTAKPEVVRAPEFVAPARTVGDAKAGLKAKPSVPIAPRPAPAAPMEAPVDPNSSVGAGRLGLGGGGGAGRPGLGGGGGASLSVAQDADPVTTESASRGEAAPAAVKQPLARTAPPGIEGEDRMTRDAAAAASPLDQLVKQCETAAARGDCAAVREIARKILTRSPLAYKTRIVTHTAIHKCLPSSAAAAAAE